MDKRKYAPATCMKCLRRIKLTPRLALYRHTYMSAVCSGSGQGGIMHCNWCDEPVLGEDYMVQDQVWDQAFGGHAQGLACLSCLESRLGRELERVDFTDAPINVPGFRGWPVTAELLDRLRRTDSMAGIPLCGNEGPEGLTCVRRAEGHVGAHHAIGEDELVMWFDEPRWGVQRSEIREWVI